MSSAALLRDASRAACMCSLSTAQHSGRLPLRAAGRQTGCGNVAWDPTAGLSWVRRQSGIEPWELFRGGQQLLRGHAPGRAGEGRCVEYARCTGTGPVDAAASVHPEQEIPLCRCVLNPIDPQVGMRVCVCVLHLALLGLTGLSMSVPKLATTTLPAGSMLLGKMHR